MSYVPKVHYEDGGDTLTVESGGVIKLKTGAILGRNDGTQSAAIADASQTQAAITDSSGGAASQTIAAIGATYDQDEVRNAVASLADEVEAGRVDVAAVITKLNAIIDVLQNHGLMAS